MIRWVLLLNLVVHSSMAAVIGQATETPVGQTVVGGSGGIGQTSKVDETKAKTGAIGESSTISDATIGGSSISGGVTGQAATNGQAKPSQIGQAKISSGGIGQTSAIDDAQLGQKSVDKEVVGQSATIKGAQIGQPSTNDQTKSGQIGQDGVKSAGPARLRRYVAHDFVKECTKAYGPAICFRIYQPHVDLADIPRGFTCYRKGPSLRTNYQLACTEFSNMIYLRDRGFQPINNDRNAYASGASRVDPYKQTKDDPFGRDSL